MRKVKVFGSQVADKTEVICIGEAIFHQFGKDFEEFENGGCEVSVAIIEWPASGKVEMIRADMIQFIS